MAKNYDALVNNITDYIGGCSNVTYFSHCVSRLRFNVKDKGLVKMEEIEKTENVIGCQWSGDQFQIIIGTGVAEAYQQICTKTDFTSSQSAAHEKPAEKKTVKTFINGMFDGISGCLSSMIPVILCGGMLKILLILLEVAGVSAQAGTYQVISFVADAAFYFLPVFVGASAANKFNVNMGLGMLVGAMLIAPNFIALVNDGVALNIFGLPIYATTYSSTVFPIIMSVYVMSYIQKFITKYSPEVLKGILVPLLTILLMMPIALCILGPLGNILGNYLATGIIWLYDTTGFLGVGVFAAILPFIIITGMHFGFFPYLFAAFANPGYEPFYCIANTVFNINQGAACLAIAIRTKNLNVKSMAATAGITAIVAGVSEPALFGVSFKYKKALWCSMIGCFAGGIIAGIFHVTCYAFASFGLIGLPSYVTKDGMNLIYAIVALAISAIITFVLTLITVKPQDVA